MSTYCVRCGKEIESWDGGYYTRGMLCIPCFSTKQGEERLQPCRGCGRRIRPEVGKTLRGQLFCEDCFAKEKERIAKSTCVMCGKELEAWEPRRISPDGKVICESCFGKGMGRLGVKNCARCGKQTVIKFISEEEKPFCLGCAGELEKELRAGRANRLVRIIRMLLGNE